MGYPPNLGWGPSQTWDVVPSHPPRPGMGYPPDLGWGTPHTWDGVPPRPGTWYLPIPPDLGWGTPPDLGWGTPQPGMGSLQDLGHGTFPSPQTWDGVPLLTWDGVPLRPGMGYPPNWDIVSTCYAAGSMPLVFMQEDFLVITAFQFFFYPTASQGL